MPFTNKFIIFVAPIICLIAVLLSCVPTESQKSSPAGFQDYTDEERIEIVINYSLNYHKTALESVAEATQLPKALLLGLLARERFTDWEVHGDYADYRFGDLAKNLLGVKASVGPANISLQAITEVERRRPKLFNEKFHAQDAYNNAARSETESVLWGAHYLKVIYYDFVIQDKLSHFEKWVKSLGLYNEGLDKDANFKAGRYSEVVRKILYKAAEKYPPFP